MTRHRYDKEPGNDGVCTCGQGRSEDIHRMLVWHKARTGNWLSEVMRGAMYRCREAEGKWIPELADNPHWFMIGPPMTLAKAKAVCEQNREERSQ